MATTAARVATALAALALVLCAAPRAAWAQPASGEYDRLIEHGVSLREQSHDAEALAEFERAWALNHAPEARAQMGLAEQALGQWVDAEAHVTEALAAARDPWIARNRAALESALGLIRQHLGSLEVRCATAGAEVLIDGAVRATLPRAEPIRVVAGSVTFQVRAPRFHTVTRATYVDAGRLSRETVNLVPESPAEGAPEAGATGTTAPTASATGVARTNPAFGPTTDRPRGALPVQRVLGPVALGVAAVGVGVGIAGLVLRAGHAARWNNDQECLPPSGATRMATCGAELDAVHTSEAVAVAGFVAGGVFATLGVVLMATAPTGGRRPSARATALQRLRCGDGPGVLGLACGGSF